MASGIAVNPKCIEVYEALNKRAYGGAIFKINPEMTEVALEKTFEPNDTDPEGEWKAIIGSLPKDECRYILTDFKWKETPTVTKSKVMLVLWSSEIAAIKFKMYVGPTSICRLVP